MDNVDTSGRKGQLRQVRLSARPAGHNNYMRTNEDLESEANAMGHLANKAEMARNRKSPIGSKQTTTETYQNHETMSASNFNLAKSTDNKQRNARTFVEKALMNSEGQEPQ